MTGDGNARPLVARSWRRSEAHGAARDSSRLPPVQVDAVGLRELRERSALSPVLPVVRGLLASGVTAAGGVFALSDADGLLLWLGGDPAALRGIGAVNFVEGANWSESTVGTNAPGTALATGRAVQVIGAEHFHESVRPWSCVAAPVRDPDSGVVMGAIDISGREEVQGPLALTLARATATAAEGELRQLVAATDARARERFRRTREAAHGSTLLVSPGGRVVGPSESMHVPGRVLVPDRTAGSRLTVAGRSAVVTGQDPDGYLVLRLQERAGSRPARPPAAGSRAVVNLHVLGTDTASVVVGDRVVQCSARHSEILFLLTTEPTGMSAGRLAVELSDSDRSTTSVRAEMHRLRLLLGCELLGSQPYRLLRPVRSDVDEVRRLVRAGRSGDALEAYPGPLLPASEAPGVVAERFGLHRELRDSLVGSRDVRLLRRAVDTPWGRDDPVLWAALARVLPPGSRPQAAARHRVHHLRLDLGPPPAPPSPPATPSLPRRP